MVKATRNVVIGGNLLTLFIISKISGIFLVKFENDTSIGNRERDLFQKQKCYIGVIANIFYTSFFSYIIIRGVLAIDKNFKIGDFMFIGMFVGFTLLLINAYISNELTVSCLNEAYKLLKLCKAGDPISAKSMLLIALPCLAQMFRPLVHQLPMDTHTLISVIGICLQNFIAIPTVLIIILVMRISEITSDKIISDLIALGCMSPNTCYFKLRRVLVLYTRLADFIDSVSPAFAFKILALVADYFSSSYFLLIFTMISSTYYGPLTLSSFIESVAPLISIQLRMIILCSVGNQMQQKASKIEKHVDDLLIKAVMKDQYLLKTKLAAFKIEIQTRRYKISPYGFFSLNMDLYTSILTVMASNSAMILQVYATAWPKTK